MACFKNRWLRLLSVKPDRSQKHKSDQGLLMSYYVGQ